MNLLQPLFSVVRRSRASALLLAAALVMAAVATTLVAAVPLYSTAVVEAGLRSSIGDATPTESGFEAAFRAPAASWDDLESTLSRLADERLPGHYREGLVARSDTYQLPVGRSEAGWITTIGVVRGAELRDVTRPLPAAPGTIAVRLHTAAADLLDLDPGQQVTLQRPGAVPIVVDVVALVEPADRADKIWWDDPLVRDGVVQTGSFTEIGPFLVDPEALAALGGTANVRWRVLPDSNAVRLADIAAWRAGIAAMASAIGDRLDVANLVVDTEMPESLAAADTAIGSTAAVIAAILLQLVGVALYGVGLSASVLASSRVAETATLRARGASPAQLGSMAALEAVLVAAPAVVLGPVAGVRVVKLLESWGPVALAELELRPSAGRAVWAGVVVVGVLIVGIVTWPAVRSARTFRPDRAPRSTFDARHRFQRNGLDLVVVALAALGLWRLRHTSVATSDTAGRIGTDPILVLAPLLGVVAGSLLTLRLVAATARGIQRVTVRRGSLPTALAVWEVARRPARTARTSVLIVLSVTVGTFAAVHGASWQQSIRDQADAVVSVDALVTPDPRPASPLPSRYVADAYRRLTGVEDAIPVHRSSASVSAGLSSVTLVSADAAALGAALRFRSDLHGDDWSAAAYASLNRPADVGAIDLGLVGDAITVGFELEASPSSTSGEIVISATLLDRAGTPVLLEGGRIDVAGSGTTTGGLTFATRADSVTDSSLGLDGPVRLVSLNVAFPSVRDDPRSDTPLPSARYRLSLGPVMAGGGRSVPLAADWSIGRESFGGALVAPSAEVAVDDGLLVLSVDSGSTTQARTAYRVTIDTSRFDDDHGAGIPVVVTPGLLEATALSIGDRFVARANGSTAALVIEGVVPVVPFAVDESLVILADWETISVDRYVRSRRFEAPDAWALTIDDATAERLGQLLAEPPYAPATFIERRQQARAMSREPITVGLAGSLALALAASLVVASVGLALTAVVGGRERRPTFAVLRAMGARAAELRRWLLLETVPLVGLSAAAGLVSGIGLAYLVLPSLGLDSDGMRAVPVPRLVIPWSVLAIVVTIATTAGMALPVATARLLRRYRTADELRVGDTT